MLYGYSEVIFKGAMVTLELAVSSLVVAVVLGLIGAGPNFPAVAHWWLYLKATLR